jgi:hypothetical protein
MSARLHVGGALRAELQAVLIIAVAGILGCGGGDAETGPTEPQRVITVPPPAARPPAPRLTHAAVLRRLRGRRVRVGHRRVRLDPATLTCVGVGTRGGTGRAHTWTRFRCVQPTFPPGATVGPDVIFFVEPGRHGTLKIGQSRLTRY